MEHVESKIQSLNVEYDSLRSSGQSQPSALFTLIRKYPYRFMQKSTNNVITYFLLPSYSFEAIRNKNYNSLLFSLLMYEENNLCSHFFLVIALIYHFFSHLGFSRKRISFVWLFNLSFQGAQRICPNLSTCWSRSQENGPENAVLVERISWGNWRSPSANISWRSWSSADECFA